MENQSLVSIIVPVFKIETYLPSLITNFDRQTYSNFELILINDCSPDSSGRIMRNLTDGKKYAVKCYDHEKNMGPGKARNTGLSVATGKYIMFIDADDSFSDFYIETMKYIIEKDNVDLACCSTCVNGRMKQNTHNILYNFPSNQYKYYQGNIALKNFYNTFDSEINFIGGPWAKIIRKSFYDRKNLKYTPDYLGEDLLLSFKELCLANSVACYNSVLYYHNPNNPDSISKIKINEALISLSDFFNKHTQFVLRNKLSHEACSVVLRMYFNYLKYAYHLFLDYNTGFSSIDDLINFYQDFLPPFPVDGNEYYIFIQLFILFMQTKIYGTINHFAILVKPYQKMLKKWLLDNRINVFNKGQIKYIHFFSTIQPNYPPKTNPQILISKIYQKFLSNIYIYIKKLSTFKFTRKFEKYVIKKSEWFDSEYFKHSNPEIDFDGNSSLDYFIENVSIKQNDPNDWFDIKSFFKQFPDVQSAGYNPIVFFYLIGLFNRRWF